jgi:hypothetical protein
VALRAIGVTVDRFLEADLQLDLWGMTDHGTDGATAAGPMIGTGTTSVRAAHGRPLQMAIDTIRTRWGARALTTS